MPHLLQTRTSRRAGPRKGNKHAGIYGKKKDICPTPKGVHFTMNIPMEYAVAIQDKYPDLTLYKAIRTHILATIEPKEILR